MFALDNIGGHSFVAQLSLGTHHCDIFCIFNENNFGENSWSDAPGPQRVPGGWGEGAARRSSQRPRTITICTGPVV